MDYLPDRTVQDVIRIRQTLARSFCDTPRRNYASVPDPRFYLRAVPPSLLGQLLIPGKGGYESIGFRNVAGLFAAISEGRERSPRACSSVVGPCGARGPGYRPRRVAPNSTAIAIQRMGTGTGSPGTGTR